MGGYPTKQGAWTNLGMKMNSFRGHHRHSGSGSGRVQARDMFPRYLNSGVMLGRVGQACVVICQLAIFEIWLDTLAMCNVSTVAVLHLLPKCTIFIVIILLHDVMLRCLFCWPQIKEMYRTVMNSNLAMMYIDDQHMLNNYAHRHPSLISLDYTSQVFLNGYGLGPDDIELDENFALVWRDSHLDGVAGRGDMHGKVLCASAFHGSGSGKLTYERCLKC
jgi:hypothetical protein